MLLNNSRLWDLLKLWGTIFTCKDKKNTLLCTKSAKETMLSHMRDFLGFSNVINIQNILLIHWMMISKTYHQLRLNYAFRSKYENSNIKQIYLFLFMLFFGLVDFVYISNCSLFKLSKFLLIDLYWKSISILLPWKLLKHHFNVK